MGRMIDAEPVEEFLENKVKSLTGRSFSVGGYSGALEKLKTAPTVDAVPVIRCKDCQHWGPRLEEYDGLGLCWAFGAQPAAAQDENGYCNRAKRKTE